MVNIIKNGLIDLENDIGDMSENEIKIEKADKIVEEILKFNKQN